MRRRPHDENQSHIWDTEAVQRLGMTTDLETAAAVLGISRTLAFELAKRGKFPVRLLRLGRRVLIPVPDLLKYLGSNAGNCTRCTNQTPDPC